MKLSFGHHLCCEEKVGEKGGELRVLEDCGRDGDGYYFFGIGNYVFSNKARKIGAWLTS